MDSKCGIIIKERRIMLEIIKSIITNVLTALYQPFGFALLLAVLFMFMCMSACEHGWKAICRKWWDNFKLDKGFRRMFFLAFYSSMILFRTLLNRNMWANPLSNVMGSWGLYNEQGELTTEAIENLALFIPFAVLLLWALQEKYWKENLKFGQILWRAVKTVFLFSLCIEFAQLFFRLGTFQISDLVYNTLGGAIGGILYFAGCKIKGQGKSK